MSICYTRLYYAARRVADGAEPQGSARCVLLIRCFIITTIIIIISRSSSSSSSSICIISITVTLLAYH